MLVTLPDLAHQLAWKSVCDILHARLTGFWSDVLVLVSGDQRQGSISLLLHRAQSSLRRDLPQPVKKFPTFSLIRYFLNMSTADSHLSYSLALSIQSSPFHPRSLRSTSMLSFHMSLGCQSGLLPSVFHAKFRYLYISSTTNVSHGPPIPSHLPLLNAPNNFTFLWPCIVTNFFIIKPSRCTNFPNLLWHETTGPARKLSSNLYDIPVPSVQE